MLTKTPPIIANDRTPGTSRVDLLVMAGMVEQGARVLDVGCGDGELLKLLGETRGGDGRDRKSVV